MRKNVLRSIPLVAALVAAASACQGDSDSGTAVTPNPTALQPRGTIQGWLRDRVTEQPIVGATIDIGVASATTAADGQFVLANVPATEDALNHTVAGSYLVTVDLQRVTSPVDMTSGTASPRYPKFAYAAVSVAYTSLDDTAGPQPGSGGGSNHDTPVTGLVADLPLSVGKLAAAFTGVVAGCADAAFYQPVGAGYTVLLLAAADASDSSTGAPGNAVQTTTTDAAGAFAFSGVESLGQFRICARDPSGVLQGCSGGGAGVIRTAPTDGQTEALTIQASTAVHVCPVDIHGPEIVAVSPAPGASVTPGAASVVLAFSEPVAQTALTSTTPGSPGNLFDRLEVSYAGRPGGPVAHALAWNATFDRLTVSFTIASAGLFWVRLQDVDGLRDAAGNPGVLGVCPDDAAAPAAYGIVAAPGANDCTVWFSTSAAVAATSPAALAIPNLNALQATGSPVVLDWLPSAGATSYDVYKTVYRWPGYPVAASDPIAAAGSQAGTTFLLASTQATSLTDDCPFQVTAAPPLCGVIEGDAIPLAVRYTVKGVGADGVEAGDAGASANASDKVAPRIAAPPGAADFSDAAASALLAFDEDMSEAAAELATSYGIVAWGGFATPTFAAAPSAGQYLSRSVTLQFANLEFAITPGANGLCETAPLAGSDDQAGAGMAVGQATCTRNGANAVRDATLAGDDVACGAGATGGVCPGPDGVCATTASGDDVQVTAAGAVPKCVTEGANGLLATSAAGDDLVTHAIRTVTLSSAVTDVAGNPVDATRRGVTKQTVSGAFTWAP